MEKEATEDITNLMNTNRRWKTKACGGTDYHSHVLPKMDDGAKEIEISIEMLRKLKQQGIFHGIRNSSLLSAFRNCR